MPGTVPSNRRFGLVFTAVFLVIAATVDFRSAAFYVSSAIMIVVFFISLAIPRVLAPLKRLWLKLGLLLNRVVSPIFLGLVYILAIVPVGALVHLFGKDLLSLKYDRHGSSYWKRRNDGYATTDSLKDQF